MKNKLERATIEYWAYSSRNSIEETLKRYITKKRTELGGKSLIAAELDYAKKEGNITEKAHCRTLVLLVGLSLEPLLQSVIVYKPEKIVLILNNKNYPVGKGTEGAEIFADHLVGAVKNLYHNKLIENVPETSTHITKYNEVFKALVHALNGKNDVVIDITGGKKSMVTSAFLYAAFSGVRISYVDFDEYCPENRRPYGFSCKIGELPNPYEAFSLRGWEKIKMLYKKYQFNEAHKILEDIKKPMVKELNNSETPIDNLMKCIKFYSLWDAGDYRKAKNAHGELARTLELPPELPPSAVEILGENWYKFDDPEHKPDPIYGDLEKLVVYVSDEMARIRRLIDFNEDYRSAFIHAGGISEIIMLGRLLCLVEDEKNKKALLEALKNATPNAGMMFDAFWDKENEKGKEDNIKIGNGGHIKFQGFRKKDDPEIEINIADPMNPWWKDTGMFSCGYTKFLDKRNEVAHKYFPVPKEWAEDGLAFVKANFDDFKNCMKYSKIYTVEALSWPKLCKLCKVDKFLTPNLRSDD